MRLLERDFETWRASFTSCNLLVRPWVLSMLQSHLTLTTTPPASIKAHTLLSSLTYFTEEVERGVDSGKVQEEKTLPKQGGGHDLHSEKLSNSLIQKEEVKNITV